VVREVLRIMGTPESMIQFVKDRPGHDRRYAIDCSKIRQEWGWESAVDFGVGLAETIAWYQSRQDWIQGIKDASYLSYYERMYTRRDETLSRLNQ
jgi:dTDP-glucose 4,6-dehydratase